MADYYPVLARAVAQLPNDDAKARQELYNNARRIIEIQLRKQGPQQSTQKFQRERAALERAISRLEQESPPRRPSRASEPKPTPDEAEQLQEMPGALGIFLFRIAFLVTMAAMAALIYIRGLVLVVKSTIGYPTLWLAMAVVVGLIFVLSRAVFRATENVGKSELKQASNQNPVRRDPRTPAPRSR